MTWSHLILIKLILFFLLIFSFLWDLIDLMRLSQVFQVKLLNFRTSNNYYNPTQKFNTNFNHTSLAVAIETKRRDSRIHGGISRTQRKSRCQEGIDDVITSITCNLSIFQVVEAQAVVEGLKPSMKYKFRVRARTSAGYGNYSNLFEFGTSRSESLSSNVTIIIISLSFLSLLVISAVICYLRTGKFLCLKLSPNTKKQANRPRPRPPTDEQINLIGKIFHLLLFSTIINQIFQF